MMGLIDPTLQVWEDTAVRPPTTYSPRGAKGSAMREWQGEGAGAWQQRG
jgi:hypothetical protein